MGELSDRLLRQIAETEAEGQQVDAVALAPSTLHELRWEFDMVGGTGAFKPASVEYPTRIFDRIVHTVNGLPHGIFVLSGPGMFAAFVGLRAFLKDMTFDRAFGPDWTAYIGALPVRIVEVEAS